VDMGRTVAEHNRDAVACDEAVLPKPTLQLRDAPSGFGIGDHPVVEVQKSRFGRSVKTGRDQRRAVQRVVRMTLGEILGVSVHGYVLGKTEVSGRHA
jgi:hypothetical protein